MKMHTKNTGSTSYQHISSGCEYLSGYGVLSRVKNKDRQFSELPEDRKYDMNHLVDIPQFYFKQCTDNGVQRFDINLQGLCCDFCHNLFNFILLNH